MSHPCCDRSTFAGKFCAALFAAHLNHPPLKLRAIPMPKSSADEFRASVHSFEIYASKILILMHLGTGAGMDTGNFFVSVFAVNPRQL